MEDPPTLQTRARASMMALVVVVGALGARATQLQLARRPSSVTPVARSLPARPTRGRIVDARGEVLADNVPRWELDVIPARLRQRHGGVARLARLLGVNESSLDALFEGRGQRVVRVRRHLDADVAESVRRDTRELPGVWLTPVQMRRYPQGAVASAVVGGMRDVAPDDAPGPYGYRLGDRIGHTGVERSWDLTLRGNSTLAPTHEGMTLATHLDLRLQRAAWDALDGVRGAAVALDPRDGRVLAYVDRPSPDPNAWEHGNPGRVGEGYADDAGPVTWMLAPILVAQARAHGVPLGARVRSPRGPSEGHPRCTARGGSPLGDVVANDCVASTPSLFNPAWMEVRAALQQVGFGRTTGIDLREEPIGFANQGFYLRDAPPPGAHAYDVSATPLQLAVAYATIVNGGTVYQPRIVHEVRYPDGSLESRTTPVVADRVDLPSGESQRTLASLARWADARRGAPADAGLPPMGAFAQEDEWFVAVAPADAPRVVLVVHAPAPPHGAERAALGILRAWHRLSSEHP